MSIIKTVGDNTPGGIIRHWERKSRSECAREIQRCWARIAELERDNRTLAEQLHTVSEGFKASRQREAEMEAQVRTAGAAGLEELNDELRFILGRPCFTVASLAEELRRMGQDIKRRAEDEQAAAIHWMLGLYLKHGDEWRTHAEAEVREARRLRGEGE